MVSGNKNRKGETKQNAIRMGKNMEGKTARFGARCTGNSAVSGKVPGITPEFLLWAAVVQRAMFDARKPERSTEYAGAKGARVQDDAHNFLLSDRLEDMLIFMGIDPEVAVRIREHVYERR